MPQPSQDPFFIAAKEIPVSLFRQTLIWPLALHMPASDDPQATLKAYTSTVDRLIQQYRAATSRWIPVDDPSEHLGRPAERGEVDSWRAQRFAEAVYFHDFVQEYLFSAPKPRPEKPGKDDIDGAPFRLFRRTDIKHVEVTLRGGRDSDPTRKLTLVVERINLYLFRTGTAALVVEVAAVKDSRPLIRIGQDGSIGEAERLLLSDVQDFHEQFRRAYIPFADGEGRPANLVVKAVCWLTSDKVRTAKTHTIDASTYRKMVAEMLGDDARGTHEGPPRRYAPIFQHWKDVLDDALPLSTSGFGADMVSWRHVVDERMPTMCTISVTNHGGDEKHYYDRTYRADLVRLCFADGAAIESPSKSMYDPVEIEKFESEHAYQAFRDSGSL